LQRTTKEEFNTAISILNSDDMKISVTDSKNAAEIRKIDAEQKVLDQKLESAESLKPKNCDCECGSETSPVPARADSTTVLRTTNR
jgi:hypothetical protein